MIFRRDVGKLRNRRNETSGAGIIGREGRGRSGCRDNIISINANIFSPRRTIRETIWLTDSFLRDRISGSSSGRVVPLNLTTSSLKGEEEEGKKETSLLKLFPVAQTIISLS